MKKLRPCDCRSFAETQLLNEVGIGQNNESIRVEPNSVVIEMNHTILRIPMNRFKLFAEWYLEEQEVKTKY